MQLPWLVRCGLLEEQPDTGVLQPYPLEVKTAIIEQVVGYYHSQYAKACEGLTDLSHLKWTLEVIGAAFALPLPAGEGVVYRAIALYRTWVHDAARRPKIVDDNSVLVCEQIYRHVSQLFAVNVAPPTRANQDLHQNICLSALELFVAPCLGADNRETRQTSIRLLLGLCDFTFSAQGGVAELSYVLVSVLYEALLTCSFLDDALWSICCRYVSSWGSASAPIRQWAAVVKGLTIAVQPTLLTGSLTRMERETVNVAVSWAALPRNFRKATDAEIPTPHAFATWRRFLELLGNINRVKDPTAYALAASGVRDVLILCSYGGWWAQGKVGAAVPLPAPCADSLFRVFEPTLLESVFADSANLMDGRAQVVHALCAVLCRPHPRPLAKLREIYACIQHAAAQAAAAGGDAKNFRGLFLQSARGIFTHRLPGVACLIPVFLRLAEEVTPVWSDGKASFSREPAVEDDSDTDEEDDLSHLVGIRANAIAVLRGVLGRTVRMGMFDVATSRPAALTEQQQQQQPRATTPPAPRSSSAGLSGAGGSGDVFASSPPHRWLQVALRMFVCERDVENRSSVIQMLGVWVAAQAVRLDAEEVRAVGGGATPRPLQDILEMPEGRDLTLATAGFVAHEVLAILRGKHSPRVHGAALATLHHCLLPLCATVTSWPPEGHSARGVLRAVCPTLPGDMLRGLLGFLANLYDVQLISHLKPVAISQLIQRGLQVLHDVLLAHPELLVDAGALPPLMEVLDNLMRMPQHSGVPPPALAVYMTVMRAPDIETQYQSKVVVEENYKKAEGTVTRYFAVDGLRVMTVISHPPDNVSTRETPGALMGRHVHSGGVTMIMRDAFGRHVWDARMDLGARSDEDASDAALSFRQSPSHVAGADPHVDLAVRRGGSGGGEVPPHPQQQQPQRPLGLLDELLSPIVVARDRSSTKDMEREESFARSLDRQSTGVGAGGDDSNELCQSFRSVRTRNSTGGPAGTAARGDVRFPDFTGRCVPKEYIATPKIFAPPGGEPAVDHARLLLAHLQCAPHSARMVELPNQAEVLETLRMVDNTPPRELHSVSVVYFHEDAGEAVLQDLGVEWYVKDAAGGIGGAAMDDAPPRLDVPALPTINEFLDFLQGVGWPLDPAQRPDCYSGGVGGDRWRRQRVHYHADTLHEMLFVTSSQTPSKVNADADGGGGGGGGSGADTPAPDAPSVRVIWNDTAREWNPSAHHASQSPQVVKELCAHLPHWAARSSRTLDIVVQPLDDNLVSLRVILPLANERWLGLLSPSAFSPSDWFAPVLDGMVVPTEILPHMIRRACLSASQAMKSRWQPMFEEIKKNKKAAGVDFTQRRPFTTYMPPIATRAAMLSRCCQSAVVVDGAPYAAPHKVAEGMRVCALRPVDCKQRRIVPGEKGTVRRHTPSTGRVEVAWDRGLVAESAVGDVAPVPIPVNFSWSGWREAHVSAAAVVCSLFSVAQREGEAVVPTGRLRARGAGAETATHAVVKV